MKAEELSRMRKLASIGAGHAATAFSQLARRTVRMRLPEVFVFAFPDQGESAASAPRHMGHIHPDWSSGVLFEFEGFLGALVGVFFRRSVRDAVVRRVLGEPDGPLPPGSTEAVLMETYMSGELGEG